MDINWTIEGVVELIASIPTMYSFILLLREYFRFKDRALLSLSIGWFSFGMLFIMNFFSYLTLSRFLFAFKTIFLVTMAMGIVHAVLILMYERLHTPLYSLFMFVSLFTLYTAFLDESIADFSWPNGERSFASVGIYRLFFTLTSWLIMFIYGWYAFRLYYNAPKSLKRSARMHLIGFLILGPIALLIFLFKLNWIIPGLQAVAFGIGITITSKCIARHPQLLHVLPFKAHKLVVIEKNSGLVIFSYNWSNLSFNVSDPLFSSVLESISTFLNEATGKGRIRQIQLEGANLLIKEPTEAFYCVVLVEGMTHSMKLGLEKFSQLFAQTYGAIIKDQVVIQNELFEGAQELIRYSFPYIPHYN